MIRDEAGTARRINFGLRTDRALSPRAVAVTPPSPPAPPPPKKNSHASSSSSSGSSSPGSLKCSTTIDISKSSSYLWKTALSHHISNPGDPRQGSTTLVAAKRSRLPLTSCVKAYDSRGHLVHQLGQYERNGAVYGARFYGGSGCGTKENGSTIVTRAKSGSGSETIYLDFGGGYCVMVPHPGTRQGAVQ